MRSIILSVTVWMLSLALWPGASLLVAQQAHPLLRDGLRDYSFSITHASDSIFSLPDQFIIEGSAIVSLDSLRLHSSSDYTIQARSGILRFKPQIVAGLPRDSSRHVVQILYRFLPFNLKPSYRLREKIAVRDTLTGTSLTFGKPSSTFSLDDLFGANLQKSGSIVRGLNIGTNRDMTLNSGFRMQMSGNLTNDLEVIAALTDENTPIQPEGTTQTLQEIDKVFIELKGNNVDATLGDFTIDIAGNEFGGVSRKLQGAKGFAQYKASDNVKGEITLSGASPKGKYTSNQFGGIDGVQGPYLLAGENNNRSIIVIAGTERVYLDGVKMSRGENEDYVVDYGNAEVTFTTKRLIHHGSRITVDFEYTDRQFGRTFLAAKAKTQLLGERFTLNTTVARESDNENAPVDIAITDSDRVLLQQAGGDRSKALRPGAIYVGTGKGQYVKYDSLVVLPSGLDSTFSIYRFDPFDTLHAVYAVSFTNVGPGVGSYRQIALGRYQFVGIGQGNYEPVRYLPMPQSHLLTDIDANARISDDLTVLGEFAMSKFNPNLFSLSGADQQTGGATRVNLSYAPRDIKIGSLSLGSADLTIRERYVGKRFIALDRVNEVEFSRKWNVVDSTASDEELREGLLTLQPIQPFTLSGSAGVLKRGDSFSTNRYTFSGRLLGESVPHVEYEFEDLHTRSTRNNLQADWIRQHGIVERAFGILTPGLRVANEHLTNRRAQTDTLIAGSYRLTEVLPGVSVNGIENVTINAEAGWRWEDSLHASMLTRASRAFTQHYFGQYLGSQLFTSSLDLSLQHRTSTEPFRANEGGNGNTLLLRWQSRLVPVERGIESDWFYEVSTERTAKQQQVFQRVPKGLGNYIYAGDLNGNHIIDQADFELTRFDGEYVVLAVPTDQLLPVINLRASTRIRVVPSKFLSRSNSRLAILSALSSETNFRVEEKSSDPDMKEIYLLRFSRMLSDQYTLAGSTLLTQDLFVLENDQGFSARLRYQQRKGLTQFALLGERSYAREQSMRIRWQLLRELTGQIDYLHRTDLLAATQFSNRARAVVGNSAVLDWSYRPYRDIEFGFVLGTGGSTNYDTTSATLNNQAIRCTYSFIEKGQARAQFSREEAVLSRAGLIVPFELTDGRLAGRTWLWNLNFDYRLTQYLQATIGYDGRSEGGRSPVHTARAEVRAFF